MLSILISLILEIFGKSKEDKKEWYPNSGDLVEDTISTSKTDVLIYKGKMNCSCGCTTGMSELEPSFMKIIGFINKSYNKHAIVDSGYRCPDYNAKVGGAKNSMHIKWPIQAADIRVEGVSAKELYKLIDQNFPISGLGYYLNNSTGWEFVHVDSRNYKARWLRIDGKYLKSTNKNLKKYDLT